MTLTVHGSTIELTSGPQRLMITSDSEPYPSGVWTQRPVTDNERTLIQSYVSKLAKNRDAAFYIERDFGMEDVAKRQAWTVARVMLGAVGQTLPEYL